MHGTFARCVVAISAGLALMVAQGCRKQGAAPVPVQQVVRNAPPVRPDFPVGPLPVEDVDQGAPPRVDRTPRRQQPVQPVQAQSKDDQAADIALVQRRRDAMLLQQQQDASQRQQQELNEEIEQDMRMQQEMEAEPRIQDIPETPQPTQPQ